MKRRATHSPYLMWLKVDPMLDSVRSERRFQGVLKELKLTTHSASSVADWASLIPGEPPATYNSLRSRVR